MEKKSSHINYISELRKRVLAIIVFFVMALIVGGIFSKKLILMFLNTNLPTNVNLVTLNPYENISLFIHFMFFVAIALTIPFLFYQIIKYVSPSLTKKEKKLAITIPFVALILFILGSGLGYLMIKYLIVPFLSNLALSIEVVNNWSINQYMKFVIYFSLSMGLIFQIPWIILLFVKFNLLKPKQINKSRKYVIIGLFILAALVTPPDLFSLIVMVLPLVILFEITLIIARLIKRKERNK